MFQVIKKQSRPSLSVDFYLPSTSATMSLTDKRRFYEKYVLTGKHINVAVEVSPDGLTQTLTAIWDSEESANEFLNDPEMVTFINDQNAYQNTAGVSITLVSKQNI